MEVVANFSTALELNHPRLLCVGGQAYRAGAWPPLLRYLFYMGGGHTWVFGGVVVSKFLTRHASIGTPSLPIFLPILGVIGQPRARNTSVYDRPYR